MASEDRMLFVFAGGGTGGHLYPGIAVAAALRRRSPDCDVQFYTTARAIDRQILDPLRIESITQRVTAFSARPWRWPGFVHRYLASAREARQRFARRPPSVVLGLGGYASAPPVEAAVRMNLPSALFNPDALPGRANRRFIPRVDRVFVQWDDSIARMDRARRVQVTGCPVRSEFLRISREQGCRAAQLDPAKPVLLITGASQGARSINRAAMALADYLAEFRDWQIVHITGPADCEEVRREYARRLPHARVIDFTPNIAWPMAAADLIISRAGASTLAEIAVLGKPAILMPYPYDRGRHQLANAQVLAAVHGAVIVEDAIEPRENAQRLKPHLQDLMGSAERRRRMGRAAWSVGRADAADTIAAELIEMAQKPAN